jgi:ABC-2 family transporter protein
MTWLLWRQHRMQATLSAALFAVLAVALWASGVHMAHVYRTAITTCRSNGTCDNLALFQGDGALINLVNLTIVVPLLLGVLWAAPLISREFETGTHILAWTQSVSRRRWLYGKLAVLLIATVAWSAAVTGIVTWWSGTFNSLNGDRFDPLRFEIQGIVPIAYSLFAVGLGVAAGAVLRRSLPALGVTIFGYAAVRIAVDNYLRPHLLRPVTSIDRLDQQTAVHNGAWIIERTLLVDGHTVGGAIPAPAGCGGVASRSDMNHCLSDAGFRMLTRYQPASRYWTFQLLESTLFLVLAAALVLTCLIVMRRREA